MKKLLLSIAAIASVMTGVTAQTAPDMGFETWHVIAAPFAPDEDPNGWASLNALHGATTTAQSVFKETTSPAAGLISAKIVTVKVNGATIPSPYGGNLDTAGILAIGSVAFSIPPNIHYGYTYAAKPTVLSFKSKYTPMAGDSAFVLAYLTHWNGTSRDTIAEGKYGTNATTTSFASNSLTMTYDGAFAGVTPDTQQVFISSSVYAHDGAKVGSTFYIDDLVWSAFVGVDELGAVSNSVTYYPNPASNVISFESTVDAEMVEVMDITGRKVTTVRMQNNKTSILTATYAKGTYLYQVTNKEGKVISRGKFEVVH